MEAQRWLITQRNGRSYVVTDYAKVQVALRCGYTVELILRA